MEPRLHDLPTEAINAITSPLDGVKSFADSLYPHSAEKILRMKPRNGWKGNGWMHASVVDTLRIRINRVFLGNATAWLTTAKSERLESNGAT